MKKFFSSIIALMVVSFILISCGGTSNAKEPQTEVKQADQPVKTEVVKDPVILTLTPVKAFVGNYRLSEPDSIQGDSRTHINEKGSFDLVLHFSDSSQKTVEISANDYWMNGEKDPGVTDKLKLLMEEMKKMKPENLSITTSDGVIKKVVLLAVFKESTGGQMGELVTPKREIYPYMYLDNQ